MRGFTVSVMIRTGNLWTWPSTPDKVFYELGDIVGNFSTRGCWLQRPVQGDLSDLINSQCIS